MKKTALIPEIEQIRIAVILPCYNEEAAIADVVNAFHNALPQAQIVVCDNNSTDNTTTVARSAGALVIHETQRGKANAVRRLFNFVDADIYILCDGDMTYDASAAPELVNTIISEDLAMIIGARKPKEGQKTYRPGHSFGNFAFTTMLKLFFGGQLKDVLSGYRILSRSFVKSFPVLSKGFDIEVEMTVHALATGVSVHEEKTEYSERPSGSFSKLSTFRDGFRIARTIMRLVIDFQPLKVFSTAAVLQAMISIIMFQPVLASYLETGLVDRLPTAVLCLGLMITGILTGFCGVVLDSISRQRLEVKKLSFLAVKASEKDSG